MDSLLFEWKLVIRNKRLRQIFITIIFLILFFYLMILSSNFIFFDYFVGRIFFLIALLSVPGTYYGSLCFSSNAIFIEKLLITNPRALFYSIQAKYYLYCVFSLIIALIISPSVLLGVKVVEIVPSLLFSIGFMYFALFYCSLLSYQPLDLKVSNFYNFQGFTFSNQFIPFLVFVFAFGFIGLVNWCFSEEITLIIISLVGIVFFSIHKLWLNSICHDFEKTKYKRLEYFREK